MFDQRRFLGQLGTTGLVLPSLSFQKAFVENKEGLLRYVSLAPELTSVMVKSVVNSDSLYKRAKQTNGTSGEYLHIKKFAIKEFIRTNIWDGGWNHPLMYPVIRYADIVLMRAEAPSTTWAIWAWSPGI